jgi:hypothetical protein
VAATVAAVLFSRGKKSEGTNVAAVGPMSAPSTEASVDKEKIEREQAEQREHDAQLKAKADDAERELKVKDGLRLAGETRCVEVAASKPYLTGLVQIPATVIDKGVLRNVPYKSYRAGDYEMNVYGDPNRPAGVEIGVYRSLLTSREAKRNCIDFVGSVLTDPADRTLLSALNATRDSVVHDGLTVEVTPETADDSYGGWWVSAYLVSALDQARASDAELNQIAVQRDEVQTNPTNRGEWTANDLTFARPVPPPAPPSPSAVPPITSPPPPAPAVVPAPPPPAPSTDRVYVRGYTRKDGTYVHAYTRRRPK